MASALTMSSYPSGDFHRNLPWHEARWGTSYRTNYDDEEIRLPSIKQVRVYSYNYYGFPR